MPFLYPKMHVRIVEAPISIISGQCGIWGRSCRSLGSRAFVSLPIETVSEGEKSQSNLCSDAEQECL